MDQWKENQNGSLSIGGAIVPLSSNPPGVICKAALKSTLFPTSGLATDWAGPFSWSHPKTTYLNLGGEKWVCAKFLVHNPYK